MDTTKKTPTVFKSWQAARLIARKANGAVRGYMAANNEPGRFYPVACGTRAGTITGPSVCGSTIFK